MKISHVGVVGAVVALSVSIVPANADSGLSKVEMLPILAADQGASDMVPMRVDLETLGEIYPATTRLLYEDETTKVWVGENRVKEICLIVDVADVQASGCADMPSFYRHGIGLFTTANPGVPEMTASAYLLPSDVDPAVIDPSAGSANVRNVRYINLIVGDVVEAGGSPMTVTRPDGSDFTFTPLGSRSDRGRG